MTITEALQKNILLDYQKKWLQDNSKVKVWEKSRRIGASYVEALFFRFGGGFVENRRRHELLLSFLC